MVFLMTFPVTLSGVMTILSADYWGEVTYQRVIQRYKKGEFNSFLFERRSALCFHLLCGNIQYFCVAVCYMHSDKGFKAACDTKKLKGKLERVENTNNNLTTCSVSRSWPCPVRDGQTRSAAKLHPLYFFWQPLEQKVSDCDTPPSSSKTMIIKEAAQTERLL